MNVDSDLNVMFVVNIDALCCSYQTIDSHQNLELDLFQKCELRLFDNLAEIK